MRAILSQPILGLDFGSSAVKAVLLQKGLMGLEWRGQYHKAMPGTRGPFDGTKEALSGLKEWIAEQRIPTDRVVVSVPVHLSFLRTLTLPFNDVQKFGKVVSFEIEPLLPYPLEQVVVDYQVTDSMNGQTRLLAAAVPRDLMKNHLDQLARIGIDPDAVELDGMALMNLVRHVFPEPSARAAEGPDTAVLDIGAAKTLVCILRRGRPVLLRTLLWGGRDLTAAVAEACGISPDEAEEWKRQAGLEDSGISRLREKGVSQTIRRALEPLIGELVRTFHLVPARTPADARTSESQTVTDFILYGGGAKLKGLESCLASELNVRAVSRIPKIAQGDGGRWDPSLALSLGLALKGAHPSAGSRMNFRKGEFAPGREAAGLKTRGRYLWIAAVLVAALAGADLYANYSIQMSRYQGLKKQVREQFQSMFPEVKNIVDEVQQAKTAVAEMRKKSALFGLGEWTPLELTAELTKRVPAEVKIEVQDLVIEPGRLRLEAETDTFESVDKIKTSIGRFEGFRDVTVSDAKVGADQAHVRFRLTMTLAAKESE